jgi:hypothetical protein
VDLIQAYLTIRAALLNEARDRPDGWEEQMSMNAGYLLGIAVGRRLRHIGGAQ